MGIFDRIAGRLDELVGGDEPAVEDGPLELAVARGFAARGDHEAAIAELGRVVDRDATSAEAWLGLGQSLAALGRFEPARDAFRRALTLSLPAARRAHAHGGLGQLYARAGQLGKAIRELRAAAEVLPDDGPTLAALGRTLVADGLAEGADWLARAARVPGGAAELLVQAAAAKADPAAAERLLREAVTRAPDEAAIRAAMAEHLLARGEPAAALPEALAATAARPHSPAAWRALRAVHAAGKNYPAAIEAATREAASGGVVPFSTWLALALGSETPEAIQQALGHGKPDDPGYAQARALVDGTLDASGLAALALLAPTPEARLWVVRRLAPPEPPAGNIYALLSWAEALAARHPRLLPLAVPMARAVEAFDRPLLVAVMGEFNAGKSSFVNALAGEAIAPVGVTPTTATINVLRHGPGGGRAIFHDGTARELPAGTVNGFLSALGDEQAAAVRQVEIFAPLEALRRVEIVDTPGLNALRPAHERIARDFLVEADAIVWVFSAGQAAKATERDALALAHAAGKRVLGVINKVDRAAPDEVQAVVAHVQTSLGDLVERVVPFSARTALEGRQLGNEALLESSGMPAVEAALEAAFFTRARELKRATALAALARFVDEARAASAVDAAGNETTVGGDQARAELRTAEQTLHSAIAAERVALRARLAESVRVAALEVRELLRPGAWPFGEATADPRDELFLSDLLDDGVAAATRATQAALCAAIPRTGLVPEAVVAELDAAVDAAVDRFRWYARGVVEGAAALFFKVELPRIRLDAPAIQRALARFTPDPEEVLFHPLTNAVTAFVFRAGQELTARRSSVEIAGMIFEQHLTRPLEALAAATAALGQVQVAPDEVAP